MAKRRRRRKSNYQLKVKKRPCPFQSAGIVDIDFKDIELIKGYITERGKIIPRRISGLSSRSQKRLTAAIKRARNIALISFSEGYVPQAEIEA